LTKAISRAYFPGARVTARAVGAAFTAYSLIGLLAPEPPINFPSLKMSVRGQKQT
jgi:hypothetical protein